MASPPTSIKARQQAGLLELQWPHATYRLPYRFLRGRCPCASCVDEFTGVRVVDIADVPVAIAPTDVRFSGNYALKIVWNDRHDTGLFTWDYLELLANELAAAQAAAASNESTRSS